VEDVVSDMTDDVFPESDGGLVSAVFSAMARRNPRTPTSLADELNASEQEVRQGLTALEDLDLVEEVPHRPSKYRVNPDVRSSFN